MKNLSMLGCVVAVVVAIAGCVGATGTIGRGAERVSCTPGMSVIVACGASGLGSCAGDPILTVCDGSLTEPLMCERTGTNLGSNDDFAPPDRCPSVTVVCPASGSLSVKPTAFSGTPTCNWATRDVSI